MKAGWGSGRTALLAWGIATLLVGGGYLGFRLVQGQPANLTVVLKAAAAAGLYALFVAWRFRDRGTRERNPRE